MMKITETLQKSDFCSVYRGQAEDGSSIIMKVLEAEDPSSKDVQTFYHQYYLLEKFDSLGGILKVLAKTKYQGREAIVFEDLGLTDLDRLIKKHAGFDLESTLKLGLELVKALQQLHRHKVIHRDINPANIFVDQSLETIILGDFDLATSQVREQANIAAKQGFEGTLPFLSPEQTGRTIHSLDYRSDYYSLGASLFYMLSGEYPFKGESAIDYIHKHLTEAPPSLTRINKEIPVAVEKIIHRLLAKDPKQRYQSSLGLIHDLNHALAELKESGQISDFELASRDSSEYFEFPEKIYGRETELSEIREIIEDLKGAAANPCVFIAGPSGIGKSALIRQIHQDLSQRGAILAVGKFDQYQEASILVGFRRSFAHLFDQLAANNPEAFATLIQALKTEKFEACQVLVEAVAELEVFFPNLGSPPEIGAEASQSRFLACTESILRQILESEGTPDELVLFIDDIQWADLGSLTLIKHLTQNSLPGLLLLTAFRSNEVDSTHPVRFLQQDLGEAGRRIDLEPLAESAIQDLLQDCLGSSRDASKTAGLLLKKTQGNPFYVRQILYDLEKREILFRDDSGQWAIDDQKLSAYEVSENVVEFLLAKFADLSAEDRSLLNYAACFGSRFSLQALAELSGQSEDLESFYQFFDHAIVNQFVISRSKEYRLYSVSRNIDPSVPLDMQFSHDRIQQAAYELQPEETRQKVHTKIGDYLKVANGNPTEILMHYIQGRTALSRFAATDIAKIGLNASQIAFDSSSFQAAAKFADFSLIQLGENPWQSDFQLTWDLTAMSANSVSAFGELEKAENRLAEMLAHARNNLEKAEIYQMMSLHAGLVKQMIPGLKHGLKALKWLGQTIPFNPTPIHIVKNLIHNLILLKKIEKNREKGLESFLTDEVNQDPTILMAMKTMHSMMHNAFGSGKVLLFLALILRQAKLSLKYGVNPYTAFAFPLFGVMLNKLKKFPIAFRVADIGLRLGQNSEGMAPLAKSSGSFIFAGFTAPLNYSWSEMVRHLEKAIQHCHVSGDRTYLAIASFHVTVWKPRYQQLDAAAKELERELLPAIRSRGFQDLYEMAMCSKIFVAKLRSPEKVDLVFKDKGYDEEQIAARMEKDLLLVGLFDLYHRKALIAYLFGEYESALGWETKAYSYRDASDGLPHQKDREILFFLILAARQREFGHLPNRRQRKIIQESMAAIKSISEYAPRAFEFLYQFMQAEQESCRPQPNVKTIIKLYDAAVLGAADDGNFLWLGVINQRAAHFLASEGLLKLAQPYVEKAAVVYSNWGALQLRMRVEEEFQVIFENERTIAAGSSSQRLSTQRLSTSRIGSKRVNTDRNLHGAIDFEQIFSACQVIAEQSDSEKIAEDLIALACKLSGGDRGVFLRLENEVIPANCAEPLPLSMARYFIQKREKHLISEEAGIEQGLFAKDPYFETHPVKSTLLIPVIARNRWQALLYLENSQTSGVFTESRLQSLEILAAQTAVILENHEITARLQDLVDQRTEQLDRQSRGLKLILNNIEEGILLIDADGKIDNTYSSHLKKIIGEDQTVTGRSIQELLLNQSNLTEDSRKQIDFVLSSSLGENIVNYQINSRVFPNRIVRNTPAAVDQVLRLAWQPLLNSQDDVEKILVSVLDETELEQLKLESEKRAEIVQVIEIIVDHGEKIFDEMLRDQIQKLADGQKLISAGWVQFEAGIDGFRRDLHTIKGELRFLNLQTRVEDTHQLEESLKGIADETSFHEANLEPDVGQLHEQLSQALAIKEKFFAKKSALEDQLREILTQVSADASMNEIRAAFQEARLLLSHISVSSIVDSCQPALARVAQILGKPTPAFDLSNCAGRIPAELRLPLYEVLTQCLTNSLDHGIESEDVRRDSGKSPAGLITVTTTESDSQILIKIYDDGQGLNLVKLQGAASKGTAGKAFANELEIAHSIFQQSVSTAENVSHISGRGVGMDIVAHAVKRLGGDISIEFLESKGPSSSAELRPFALVLSLPLVGVEQEVLKKRAS